MSFQKKDFKISAWTIAGIVFFIIGLFYFMIITSPFDIEEVSLLGFMMANIFSLVIAIILMGFGIILITRRKD